MRQCFLVLLLMSAQSWAGPSTTQIPKNWHRVSPTAPGLTDEFERKFGKETTHIIYTSYAVPRDISSIVEFENFVRAQFPQESGGVRISFRETSECKSQAKRCFVALFELVRKSKTQYITYVYKSDSRRGILAMGGLSGHADNFPNAKVLTQEMLGATP